MFLRMFLLVLFIMVSLPNAKAAACLDIFPSATNDNLLSKGLVFDNLPPLFPTFPLDGYLNNPETLALGNSLHLSNQQAQEIFINYTPASETSSRLYLSGSVAWNNAKINVGGNPEDLIIIISGALDINGGNTEINAIIYAYGEVRITGSVEINGAVASEGGISTNPAVNINYNQSAIENADFNDMCDALPVTALIPILDYRFDECSYTEDDGEVIDQSGNYHANTHNVPDPIDDTVINKSLNLSAPGITDWLDVPSSAVDGLDDFSMVFWLNTSVSKSQQEIFHALGRSTGDDELEVYLINGNKVRVKVKDEGDELNSGINLTDGFWHHLVITRVDDTTCLFVNGIEQDCNDEVESGTLNVPNSNAVVIGQEQDSFGGSFSSSQSFEGKLDEFKLYNVELTSAEITSIFQREQAGKNYDNTDRDPVDCNSLIAYYQMDELSWSGTTGEVLNELGTLHGTAFGGLSTDRGNPAIDGNPGTCGYGDFDGNNHYVEVADDPALDLPDQLTVTAWIYPTKLPSSGLMTILSKDENYEFHVTPEGEINWWWQTQALSTTNANISANNWYHISITYKNGEQVIYVDGQENITSSHSGNLIVNNDPLQIGSDQGYGGRYFQGAIDEVKIYSSALSATEIDTIYKEVHPCDSFIDHYEIDTRDGVGITCEADEIIIKACADTSCNTINATGGVVDLFIDGNFYKQVLVAGENGTKTTYPYLTEGDASLSLLQTYDCTNTLGTKPCVVDFKDSGFIFSDIPTQLSGKPSSTGFNAATLTLRAVEKNTETGVCQGVFPENTDVAINLSYSCADGSCQDLLAFGNNGNSYNLTTTAVAHNLRFDENSTANFTLQYPHAAKFVVNAQKDIEVVDDDNNIEIKDFTGSSNAFVERPFAFFLNFTNDSNGSKAYATTAMGDAFKKAGETFTMTATAVQWVSGQDTNNNGIPDDFSTITGNDTAENFADEELTVNSELLLPDPLLDGNEGTLVTQTTNIFSNSTVNNNYTYSEVGIITLNAAIADGDYLGGGDVVGQVTNVGRFYPDHFSLEVDTHGELAAYCDNIAILPEAMPFAYNGQMSSKNINAGAIRYSLGLNPTFTITAQSVNAANITLNYTGDFMKLIDSSITREVPTQDTRKGSLDTNLELTANFNNITTLELQDNEEFGVITYSYNNEDNFVYRHELNAEINKFTTDINLPIVSIIDPDGVTALDADGDFDNDGDLSNVLDSVLTLEPIGVEVRFGRAFIDNSYGPETSPLPQVLSVEYFEDDNYILAGDDICSLYNTNKIIFGTLNEVSLDEGDIVVKAGTFDDALDPPNGLTRQIVLPAAGAGNRGQVEVIYDIYDWLKYDWAYDDEGVDQLYNDNPRAIATFGVFRGNDRIIYQREIER